MIQNEQEMKGPVEKYFNSIGNYSVHSEIHSGRKKIDLLFTNDDLTELIAVELKIRDWKKVFFQCLYNQFNSNWCYAALWHETVPKIDKKLFKKYGIGIIVVDDDEASLLFKGRKQNSVDTHSMCLIKQNIRETLK